MAVRRCGYTELYTGDPESVVGYFASAFGFSEVAHARSDDLQSTHLQCGRMNLIVSTGRATREFTELHGDGVADIAFVCDDPGATRRSALAAGAEPAGAGAVSAFGAVQHTLLPPAAGDRPAGRPWLPTGAGPAGAVPAETVGGHVMELDHIAVCLAAGELKGCADLFATGFGMDRYSSEYIEVGTQAMESIVSRNAAGTVTFTFLEPDPNRDAGQVDAFVARNGGPGVQHLAFLVDDIISSVREVRARGVEFLNTPDAYYRAVAARLGAMTEQIADLRDAGVLADRDEWGYLLQLFTRSPHPRGTLFYELIQRHGARGFGSANIRALYESVERDRSGPE
jgi:4-hydroxymandelate synthase